VVYRFRVVEINSKGLICRSQMGEAKRRFWETTVVLAVGREPVNELCECVQWEIVAGMLLPIGDCIEPR